MYEVFSCVQAIKKLVSMNYEDGDPWLTEDQEDILIQLYGSDEFQRSLRYAEDQGWVIRPGEPE